MAWWNDLGNAIASVAEAIGDAVEGAVNAVADAVTDVVETAGNAVEDGLNAIGGAFSGIPIIGGFLRVVFSWPGGIVAGVMNLAGSIIKGASGIAGGIIGELIKITGGLLSGKWPVALKGLIDIASSITGGLFSVSGTLISLVQRIIFCQNNERTLTREEMAVLRIVFRNSISLYNIRIIQGWSGIFGMAHPGAFTLNNTIYLITTDVSKKPETLVHECVHVWQYQSLGNRYIADALGAQAVYGRTGRAGDAYDWSAELSRGKTKWKDFNKEAQAQLIEDIWKYGTLTTGGVINSNNGAFYEKQDCEAGNGEGVCVEQFIVSPDGIDHTPLAIASVKTLREWRNFRLSHFFK